MKNIIYTGLLALGLFSCELADKEFNASTGSADFTKTVVVGDSYLAGYMDNALYAEGQENGIGAILSNQLSAVGNTLNKLPLIEAGKSIGSMQNGKYVLQIVDGALSPVPTEGDVSLLSDPSKWINADAPFANVSVPGAKAIHLVSPLLGDYTLGEGNFNPFYSRFATMPGTSTVVGDALVNEPSFFVYWAGINDVLDYAINGGVGSESGLMPGDITSTDAFGQSVNGAIAMLSANNTMGVVANIPDISKMPFFTTVPHMALVLTAEQAQGLNLYFTDYNAAATANGLPTMDFVEGPNAFVIEDATYPLQIRQMKATEKVLLSAQSEIASWPAGQVLPLTDGVVLTDAELKSIADATTAFNAIIKTAASNLALADMNTWFNSLAETGLLVDGNLYTTTFVSGNVFSLDGLHPSMKGAALFANEFIKAINTKYNANIPSADVNNQPGIVFP
ncbi:SGNH/GDSL hydrolase family protein [Saccharicrinis aurantiacus]|uniref:SGNH/GDSL hydrolase family protein n=1 Tax=Saccharicrinis aurantiacus TaxID=1849719 RepID=UPI00248FF43B|nr:SGNH/GDSL hydrolase family protein [Saccharicrinis aurantiacus]